MKELRTHWPFIQLRFHCSKQQELTYHVTTVTNSSGEDAVQYFSGQIVGKWEHQKDEDRLYDNVAFVLNLHITLHTAVFASV